MLNAKDEAPPALGWYRKPGQKWHAYYLTEGKYLTSRCGLFTDLRDYRDGIEFEAGLSPAGIITGDYGDVCRKCKHGL